MELLNPGVVKGLLQRVQSVTAHQPPSDESESVTNTPTTLFACGACDTTYIAEEMECCPNCRDVLTEVPTGTDLGYTAKQS